MRIVKNKIFSFQYTVRLSDTDISGIIYFPKIFDKSVQVLEAFLDSRERSLCKLFQQGVLMPIVQASGNFYLPLSFGELVEINLYIAHLGNSSICLKYQFLNSRRELCAQTTITHVTVAKKDQSKSIGIPKELQAIFCSAV